jgi:signal transduction histidine kinase
VTVSNQGEVLSEEQLANLFLPFSRLTTGATAPVGTGLGLFISKRLVEAMGGEITAGEKDEMMAFSFALPVAGG